MTSCWRTQARVLMSTKRRSQANNRRLTSCGLPAPKYLDGHSLKPVLEDPCANVKDAAFTQIRRGSDYDGYSIRTARWRYTLWDDGRRGEQLFDLESDPREAKNVVADSKHASLVEDLKRRVRAYAQAMP